MGCCTIGSHFAVPQADWDKDRVEHGVAHEMLSHRRFCDSIFEIAGALAQPVCLAMHVASYLVHTLPFAADIWCDTVEWQEYHEFLGMLYSYIARRGKLIQMEGAWVCFAWYRWELAGSVGAGWQRRSWQPVCSP